MDKEVIAIRDHMILAQSDLYVGQQGMAGLVGRDYTEFQLAIARKACSEAMLKLNVALSLIDEAQVNLLDTRSNVGDRNDGTNTINPTSVERIDNVTISD